MLARLDQGQRNSCVLLRVTAPAHAPLLKFELIAMYSFTHLSMKIIWLVLWLLPEKVQSLRASSTWSLYMLCIFWTKIPLTSTHNFFVRLCLNFIGGKNLSLGGHIVKRFETFPSLDNKIALHFYVDNIRAFKKSPDLFMCKAERSRSCYVSALRILHGIWLPETLRLKRWNHFQHIAARSCIDGLNYLPLCDLLFCSLELKSLNTIPLLKLSSCDVVQRVVLQFLLRWRPLVSWALLCRLYWSKSIIIQTNIQDFLWCLESKDTTLTKLKDVSFFFSSFALCE